MNTTHTIIEPQAPKSKSSFMKRFLKKSGLFLLISIVIIVIGAVIIAAFFEKQIGDRLLSEINKQLDSELTVGDFDLSLLSGFPDASANLRNVIIDDTFEGTLLEANNLSFRFGLFSLFGNDLKVHSIVIEDGALFVRINKRGVANYDIIKKDPVAANPDEPESEELSLSLEEAKLKDVEIIYIDERAKQEMKIIVNDAVASGKFSSEKFSLTSFADLKSQFVELSDGRYLVGKNLVYDAKVNVDFTNGRYEFQNVDVGIEENLFKVDGVVESKGDDMDLDLVLSSNESNLETMISLLPEEYQRYVHDLKSRGAFIFNASIKGRLNDKKVPRLKVDFELKNGRISGPQLNHSLKDVTFTANFDNGKSPSNKRAVFEISDFKGYFNRELIQSKLKIANLDNPKIDFTLDGVLPLASVYSLLDNPSITKGDGEIEIKNFRLKGYYKDMISPSRIGRVKTNGVIEFDDAELTINREKMIVDKGVLKIKDNSLIVKDVKLEGAGSVINLNGKFVNALPVLFADSLNTQKAELKFQASLESPKLDMDRLYRMTEAKIESKIITKGVLDSLHIAHNRSISQITKLLKGTFQAKIDKYNYNYIVGSDFNGRLEFDNNEMILVGNTKAMKGDFNLDGKVFFEDKPYMKGKMLCNDIDLKEFFRQTENFGQEVLQYRHVKGDMNAKLAINAYWAADGTFLEDKLRVFGDIKVQEGEIVNFDILDDFGTYIKQKDLAHIKFSNMRNWMEIKNGKLYVPAMFIQTNALNLTISGRHSFENKFEYNVKVNAGQIFFSKFKKYNPDKQPQPAKKKGWFNLYYRIYGHIDKYQFKSDKSKVKRNFKNSEHRKKEIQAALKKEFGNISLIAEPKGWEDDPDIPEYHDDDEESSDDPEFIEGFEDDEEYLIEEEVKPIKKEPKKVPKKEPVKNPKKPVKEDPVIPELEGEDDEEFLDFDDDNG